MKERRLLTYTINNGNIMHRRGIQCAWESALILEFQMIKFLEFSLRVFLDTWEIYLFSIGAAMLLWAFGLGGVVPRFELQTTLYLGLWIAVMYSVIYEIVCQHAEERFTAR